MTHPPPRAFGADRIEGFDAARWGRITAGVLLAVGALNALASLAGLAAGGGGLFDGIGFLVGGLLAGEQLRRLRLVSRGEPAGSVLGALIRPMAAPLLEDRAAGG